MQSGLRYGENHPKAKLTDADVELIRQLHESGLTHEELAVKFDANKYHIGKICRYERRTNGVGRYAALFMVNDWKGGLWEQIELF